MPKPFAAFDVDGTIFKSSLAEKVVDQCVANGLFPADAFNEVYTNKRRWQANNNEGVYLAYLKRLVGTFVQQIAGVEVERFTQVTTEMIAEHQVRTFAFPRIVIRALQPTHSLVAISGSPDILVKPFLAGQNFDAIYGSVFEQEDGRFTGIAASVGDKAAILKKLVAEGGAKQAGSVALGDTMSDVPMLEFAEHSIMFNASRTLTSYGSEFGWLRVNEVKDQITALHYSDMTGRYEEENLESVIHSLQTT